MVLLGPCFGLQNPHHRETWPPANDVNGFLHPDAPVDYSRGRIAA